jgi:hypothetical protein
VHPPHDQSKPNPVLAEGGVGKLGHVGAGDGLPRSSKPTVPELDQ